MNINGHLSLLQEAEKFGAVIICEYCGVETLSLGNICMCSNCENIATTTASMLEKEGECPSPDALAQHKRIHREP